MVGGGLCDFSVSQSPKSLKSFQTLDLDLDLTLDLDLGLSLDNIFLFNWTQASSYSSV